MRIRTLLASLLLVAFVAACGGGNPTQAPGAANTDAPDATQSGGGGGGGGGGDTTFGKVHVDISGPVTKNADYGFLPAASRFGGDQGSVLTFAGAEGTNEVVTIYVTPNQPVLVTYAGTDFQASGATCTTTNWNIGGTSGSGEFECAAPLVILVSGGTATDAKIKGSFNAHN